jgi:hypothetical protein
MYWKFVAVFNFVESNFWYTNLAFVLACVGLLYVGLIVIEAAAERRAYDTMTPAVLDRLRDRYRQKC